MRLLQSKSIAFSLRLMGVPVTVALAVMLLAIATQASIIQIGSTYNIQGTNAPNDFGPINLNFDGTNKVIDNGLLTVTEQQVPTAGGGEWDVFSVATTNGGPLAGNINAYWSLGWGFNISTPAYFDATSIWWTANGVAFNPIFAFGGICCPATNPVNPAYGMSFYNSFPPGQPVDGFVTYNPAIFVTPYNFVSAGGIDPNAANGFNFAFHFDPQTPTPEPSTLLLLGSGVMGAFGIFRRRFLL